MDALKLIGKILLGLATFIVFCLFARCGFKLSRVKNNLSEVYKAGSEGKPTPTDAELKASADKAEAQTKKKAKAPKGVTA